MKSFLNNPRLVISCSLVIAIIIGLLGYEYINTQKPNYNFVAVKSGTLQTISENQNLSLNFLASGQVKKINVKAGSSVSAGQVLAELDPQNTLGSLTQAKASYAQATANYNKLVNGATKADIDVTNATLQTAQTNLTHSKETLTLAIINAITISANAISGTDSIFENPYTDSIQFISTNGVSFINQDLAQKVINDRIAVNKNLENLKTQQPDLNSMLTTLQIISTYLSDLNSLFNVYSTGNQTAITANKNSIVSSQNQINNQINSVTTAEQGVTNAESVVNQSQANLNLKTTSARPEDIAAAKAQMESALGALQIAQTAYQNRQIISPGTGIISAVYVGQGQAVTPSTVAMDFSGNTTSKTVNLEIPNSSIISLDGKKMVLLKNGNSVVQKEVVVGTSDASNTEILEGLNLGDEVVTN